MYGFFIIATLLIGTVMWGFKYFSETGGPDPSDHTKPSSTGSDPKQPSADRNPPSYKDVASIVGEPIGDDYDLIHLEITDKSNETTTSNTKHKHTSGYVGNGWWSSDSYFGWEPSSYCGLNWTNWRPVQPSPSTDPPHNEEHTEHTSTYEPTSSSESDYSDIAVPGSMINVLREEVPKKELIADKEPLFRNRDSQGWGIDYTV